MFHGKIDLLDFIHAPESCKGYADFSSRDAGRSLRCTWVSGNHFPCML